MRLKIWFFIFPVLMFLPHKQEARLDDKQQGTFCATLKTMIESSRMNFENIKKERKSGILDLYYTSKMALPGAQDTKIILGGDAWYLASKMAESKDINALTQSYQQFSQAIRKCLTPSWKQKVLRNTTTSKSMSFKEEEIERCGPTVYLKMMESGSSNGQYKILITIQSY